MARLNGMGQWPQWLAWETRRAASRARRSLGLPGLVTLALLAVVGVAVMVDQRARAESAVLTGKVSAHHEAAARRASAPTAQPVVATGDAGRQRLADFERLLPSQDDIPQALGDLLTLAEQQGLQVQRGDYRALPDPQGGFLRYRMTLPVSGDASAIRRFVQRALGTQKSLALESVQFKREPRGDGRLEARIQWVLMTHLGARPSSLSVEKTTVAVHPAPGARP